MGQRLYKGLLKTMVGGLVAMLPVVALAVGPAQVKTDGGVIEGELTVDQKVVAFKGIPYAAPPVGDLRWRAPQAAAKWSGVRSAKEFGYHCVQTGGYPDMQFHDPGPSEDCLTLNVWAPVGAKRGSLPVMVWIYGGGFVTGGTSEKRQDGQFLAHRDVVVVSMNYRLGIWGYMTHPELTAESGKSASGNYGLMDIAAALEWVKRNVAAFGGDAGNVTVFGESAGSFAVSAVMASPLSKGLMAKAIGESGGALYSSGLGFEPREVREKRDSEFAERAFGTTKLAELRRVSTEDMVRAVTAKGAARFGPDVDGYFLPKGLPAIYAAGEQAHIPVLAGWNADEGRGAVVTAKEKPTVATFAAQADKEFGARAKDFLAVYPGSTDADAATSTGDYGGDKFIAYSTWRWMEAQVQTGKAPVYRYFFTLGSPGDKNHAAALGAFHSDDIEYVFGTLDSRAEAVWRPEDRKLSDQIGQYWTNFARMGDPNGPGLPKWPTYSATGDWQVMHLDAAPEAKADAWRGRYVFLDSVWGR
ncbi:carboxylesterase family protein [Granulicella sp. dw_53]|uniref:carboxylesterase/lipase family protein n=1 Tax=Granulicella sp. dw_53 TaxID=2719792 RepID=UPI002102BACD|nr:carboxylesterase family protein [Granulicella sp. dw_53]